MDRQNADQAAQEALSEKTVVTLLAPHKGQPRKLYGPEGKRSDYDSLQKTFKHRQVVVNSIDHFHELISYWAVAGDSLIIPGQIRPDAGPIVNRRKLPNPRNPNPPDVIDVPVKWGCFDLDYLTLPINVQSSPEAAAQFVIEQIAQIIPGFDQLSLVVQASNSCGQPGKEYTAKFHFWFLLAKAWMPAKLKEVIKQVNRIYRERNPDLAAHHKRATGKDFKLLDDALFQACQPHFVANPLFVDGAVDPLPQRIWKVHGDCERLEIDPEAFVAEQPRHPHRDECSQSEEAPKARRANGASASSEPGKKVCNPSDITGNRSRNLYCLRLIRKELAEYGPQFDRRRMAERLRRDLEESNADPVDISRWSTDAALYREIENCVVYLRRESDNLLQLDPRGHAVIELSEQFLPELEKKAGVQLIKSPMSSGKTYAVKEAISGVSRVLVIVHRISLAKEVARRLGIDCYQDSRSGRLYSNRLVVCINSLHKLSRTDFDLLVVEEAEQLLRSLAGLGKDQRPNINHEIFSECIRRAEQVLALDAQMSNLTLDTLEFIRPGERFQIVRNAFPQDKTLNIHPSRASLIVKFEAAVHARQQGRGKPVALVSNSRRLVREQYERIHKDFPSLRCALITSQTTGDDEIKALLQNFDAEGGQYDVIFASPTMSTGLSIEKLDFRVFGIFEANINCPTDAAQAISRFRLAKEVDISIATGKMPIYTSRQIVEARLKALSDRDIPFLNDGNRPAFRTDLLLRVLQYEHQAKGLFAQNFLFLAEASGWTVQFLASNKEKDIFGAGLLNEGKKVEEEVRTERLLEAERLTECKFEELRQKMLPTSVEHDELERTLMEHFYGRAISEELIARDRRGAYRKSIRNLEQLRKNADELLAEDRADALGADALSISFKSRGIKKQLWSLFLRVVGLPEDGRLEGFEFINEGWIRHLPGSEDRPPVEQVFEGWTKDSLNPDALQDIQRRRLEIKAFLGRSVPSNFLESPISFINQMLTGGLAIPISECRPRSGTGNTRLRHYALHPEKLRGLQEDLLRRSLYLMGVIGLDDPDPDPKSDANSDGHDL